MSFSVMLQQLAGGMLVSIEIFFVTLLFSLPLGLLICFGRMSKNKVIRAIVSAYISIMRGTPLMLQLMVVYFGPYFIFGIRISMGYSLIAVFIAFAINYAAYFAEIYRGGIESMPVGQYEAAKILGYNKVQTFFRIIHSIEIIVYLSMCFMVSFLKLFHNSNEIFPVDFSQDFIGKVKTRIIPVIVIIGNIKVFVVGFENPKCRFIHFGRHTVIGPI